MTYKLFAALSSCIRRRKENHEAQQVYINSQRRREEKCEGEREIMRGTTRLYSQRRRREGKCHNYFRTFIWIDGGLCAVFRAGMNCPNLNETPVSATSANLAARESIHFEIYSVLPATITKRAIRIHRFTHVPWWHSSLARSRALAHACSGCSSPPAFVTILTPCHSCACPSYKVAHDISHLKCVQAYVRKSYALQHRR